MAGLLDTLRAAHQRLIDENPVNVQITRTTRAAGAKGSLAENTAGPLAAIKVRIHEEGVSGANVRNMTDLPGTRQVDKRWGLLAPWNADVQGDPNVTDTFAVAGLGTFEVKDVWQKKYAGQVYGLQGELERVS